VPTNSDKLSAKHIGYIALMQSVVVQLPNLASILKFACQGLKDLPGVLDCLGFDHAEPPPPEEKHAKLRFSDMPVRSPQKAYATIRIFYEDEEAFSPYIPYIQNFIAILGLVCEERTQRDLNRSLMKNLEVRVEERTRELSEKLDEIRCMNKDLEEARQKAEESDRLKSTFLANISHEIRTPMNGILGFSDLLRTDELDGDDRKEFINNIHTSGQRMLRLINDLVDISKIEANQLDFHANDCSLNELIDELYLLFKERYIGKHIDLISSKSLPDGQDLLLLDADRLAQVYSNLLENALKFTDEGRVEFGYSVENGMLHGFVEDTGIGITEDQISCAFERFRQVKRQDKQLNEGSGLGLSLCKAFIELQGGDIAMKSQPGKGTRVEFNIPCNEHKTNHAQKTEESTAQNSPQTKLNILLAEDDDPNYRLYETILRPKGTLHRAINGEEALALVKSDQHFDIVLMDIKMPGMDGLEATRRIKLLRPQLPIIAQTAYAQVDDRLKALEAGCEDYISKPIDHNKLYELIDKYTQTADA